MRDDWGNWFGCDNSNLGRHYPLADHDLRRNPHVAASVKRTASDSRACSATVTSGPSFPVMIPPSPRRPLRGLDWGTLTSRLA